MAIFFHTEETKFSFKEKVKCRIWIERILKKSNFKTGNLNIIFTSEDYLLKINQEYLNHNYHTDVITFDYTEGNVISGDIFIGVDQVRRNSISQKESFILELKRVIIHGVLHLMGYGDKDDAERIIMREKEEEALTLWD